MSKKHVRLSKFLSLILRHQPGKIGIELDDAGWVATDVLLAALAAHGRPTTRAALKSVVAENDKQRFAFSADGRYIRANQGHSVSVDLALRPTEPPTTLFHGTATRFIEAIRIEGLKRMSRQHVHLSSTTQTARKVGQRHGKPVILRVDAEAMHGDGYAFYRSENGVWLTDHVPSKYLTIPD